MVRYEKPKMKNAIQAMFDAQKIAFGPIVFQATKAMIDLFESESMHDLSDKFLQISYDSGKWKKWMLEDTRATDRDKAIIAGHYVFSSDECVALKAEARARIKGLDEYLKSKVKESIFRYVNAFNLT